MSRELNQKTKNFNNKPLIVSKEKGDQRGQAKEIISTLQISDPLKVCPYGFNEKDKLALSWSLLLGQSVERLGFRLFSFTTDYC